MPEELKPLPDPFDYCYEWDSPFGTVRKFSQAPHNGQGPDRSVTIFTADQMHAYALENRRAQPAAPAILMSAVFVKEGADDFAPQRLLPCGSSVYLAPPDAAPSVAPEPVAWEGGEEWESLAWELCADENGEDACNELIWEGGPIPEPWGDRWMKYEGEAKRLIALVHKHAAHPPRAPLTDEDLKRIMTMQPIYSDDRDHMHTIRMGRAVESAVRKILTAAPAEPKGADGLPVSAPRLYADEEPPGHADHGSKARDLFDAAPSEAPKPVAWQERQEVERGVFGDWYTTNSGWSTLRPPEVLSGGIRYQFRPLYAHPPRAPLTREALAEIVRSHLTSTYHCTRVWEAWHVGTMTEDDFEPASESDMAEDIADAILAAHPPRAPLTEEQRRDLVKECGLDWQRGYMPLFEGDPTNRYAVLVEAVEAAHGIGGK